jgi:outer membrane protein OmpA-like peptidoglycan-associated protein
VLAFNVPVLNGVALIKPITFGADSAKLDRNDLAKLDLAASMLKSKAGWLLITGFVKYTATTTAQMRKLAATRAKNVAIALAQRGVKVKIGYLGYGPRNTKSPQNSDRKVELRWVEDKS